MSGDLWTLSRLSHLDDRDCGLEGSIVKGRESPGGGRRPSYVCPGLVCRARELSYLRATLEVRSVHSNHE